MEPPSQLEPRVSTAAARSLTDKWRSLFTARPVLAAAIPGSLIVVGVIDYATGFDLLLSFFYLGPVALCAWHFGRRSVIAAGLGAGLVWFVADLASHHVYENAWLRPWNAAMCGASALGLGLVLHQLRVTLRQREQAYAELKTTLTRLENSTREIRHLMSQLQVVCAWTQRIRIEGKWMNLDEFLGQHLKIPLSHGISPEAMTKFIAEIELPTQDDSK